MERPVRVARLRLACLWLSQTARVLADNCVRMLIVLYVAHAGGADAQSAWYLVTPFFILPFLLLAPLNGVLSNSLPKCCVLTLSAAFSFLVIFHFPLLLHLPYTPADGIPRPQIIQLPPLFACYALA